MKRTAKAAKQELERFIDSSVRWHSFQLRELISDALRLARKEARERERRKNAETIKKLRAEKAEAIRMVGQLTIRKGTERIT